MLAVPYQNSALKHKIPSGMMAYVENSVRPVTWARDTGRTCVNHRQSYACWQYDNTHGQQCVISSFHHQEYYYKENCS